ncbi:hypothetical protein M404DRAFT_31056 [Pisolithus tinctorius Marx 270]|uniref:Integrase catalytic domain-containing protein n=1 Tax=Pisolithus tinctorius Marx 270 TaxID=870435 RepID=A0A0C3NC66_PISTI|nr:hypothetical protein M404DRAFT_31056 [Pisolithus tinctorius Marx 270]
METQLNAMWQKATILKSLGQPLKDSLVAIAMVISLPTSYSTLRTILMLSDEKLTLDSVISQVLIEEKSCCTSSAQTALVTKTPNTKGKRNDKKKKKACGYCKKTNHVEDDCYKKKADEAAKSPSQAEKDKPKEDKLVAKVTHIPPAEDSALRLFMATDNGENLHTCWVIDSGASVNMCCQQKWFTSLKMLSPPQPVIVGNGSTIPATAIGQIELRMDLPNGKTSRILLQKVYFVPDLSANLLSVAYLATRNVQVTFTGGTCSITNGTDTVGVGHRQGSLYILAARTHFPSHGALVVQGPSPLLDPTLTFPALAAAAPKSDKVFPSVKDYLARAEVETGEKANYFRSDRGGEYGSDEFKAYLKSKGVHHEKTNAYTPQENGVAERMNRTLVESARVMLKDAGLPNRYWGDAIQKKLDAKSLECIHLGFAENKKAYLCLHQPTGRVFKSWDVVFDEGSTAVGLDHVWIEEDPATVVSKPADIRGNAQKGNTSHLDTIRALGMEDHAHMESDDGDLESSEGESEDVVHEVEIESNNTPDHSGSMVDHSPQHLEGNIPGSGQSPKKALEMASKPSVKRARTTPKPTMHKATPPQPYPTPIPPRETRRSTRTRKVPPRDDDYCFFINSYDRATLPSQWLEALEGSGAECEGGSPIDEVAQERERACGNSEAEVAGTNEEVAYKAYTTHDNEPCSFNDAMRCTDADQWYAAMIDKLQTFKSIGLYEEVALPPGRKLIDSKWVYKIKRGPTSEIERYKACLVAKGFTQVHGIDYTEMFAPVTKFATIHILLALAAKYNLEIHQMDVKSAFLNGLLDEEIYLRPPLGFPPDSNKVWWLLQALYGLKQAPKSWYSRLQTVFESLGFTRSQADHSLFFKVENGILIVVAVYIDDKLILSKCCTTIEHVKAQLSQEYEMKDLGEARWILGMEILRDCDKGIIQLSQKRYVKNILECFGMSKGRAVATPIEPNLKLEKLEIPEADTKSYQGALRALMYAMLATRPDLAFTVGMLSHHAACPGHEHTTVLKCIFHYLRCTPDVRLTYKRDSNAHVIRYVDADWAADINNCRSVTGYTFILSGGAVSWSSKKQSSVALSSTEAEYMATCTAMKEAIWIHTLVLELETVLSHEPTPLLIDNQSAISLARNAMFHDRTKHIVIRHHFIREKVDSGEVVVNYVSTNDQVADMLTKGVSREKHVRFSEAMGIIFF